MKNLNPNEALEIIKRAETLAPAEIKKIQEERFKALFSHAKKHSKFYREKYENLDLNSKLEDLPFVRKSELTKNMKAWICDENFDENKLDTYLSDIANLDHLFMDKYSVSTTSGTTGVPLKMLRDNNHIVINSTLLKSRLFEGPLFKHVEGLNKKDTKYASVLATGGYHAAYTGFERAKKALEKEGFYDVMQIISIGEPLEDMVSKLNAFQPEILTGYPSVLDSLSNEQLEGRLQISPKALLCSAEQLTEKTWQRLQTRFNCPVGNVYCSTEGGEIALLCEHGHMHVNSDWIILEPVDKNGIPVKSGTISEAVLVTNLTNYVQPIIRYFVDDCIVINEHPCECGLPFPTIEILGRTDDIPEFRCEDKILKFSPIVFLNAVVDIKGIATYQFVQKKLDTLDIRITYSSDCLKLTVDQNIKNAIEDIFSKNKLKQISLNILNEEPIRAEKGKKMRSYLKQF